MSDKNKPEKSCEIDANRLEELCDLLEKKAYPKSRKLKSISREFSGGDREFLEKLDGFDRNVLEYTVTKFRLKIEHTFLFGDKNISVSMLALFASIYALLISIGRKWAPLPFWCEIILVLILVAGIPWILFQSINLRRPYQVLALLEYAIKLKAQEPTKSAHDESA